MIYDQDEKRMPEEEIAEDERLFLDAERSGREQLRIWEPGAIAVVIGRGNIAGREASVAECDADGVPIVRRASGGGAVVLMPGCLCYSMILNSETDARLYSARATNKAVLGDLAGCFSQMAGTEIVVRGDSDLVMADRKIAGNAQRRGRRAVLLHGVLLLSADLRLLDRYLPMPSRSPVYRAGRSHEDFVRNTQWSAREVGGLLKDWFQSRRSA